jgi:outer membrane protein TolC
MSDSPRRARAACALAALLWLPGCALREGRAQHRSFVREVDRAERDAAPAAAGAPFAAAAALERGALVAEVLRRNPGIAAARHAWRAALARYPQETALEDPMVGYTAGPRSFDSPQIRRAQRIEARQAFPFPGKLTLRGSAALADAEAMEHDYEAVRLRLAALASALYDDYWLAARSLAINERHLELVRELHAVALARYESGVGEQRDLLRAEVEEAELLHRGVGLAAAQRIAAQQIASLLHRPDGAEIPPPPDELAPVETSAADESAAERAIAERPELRAARTRIAAKEAAEKLARLDFFPDVALTGGYDTFWEMPDQRPFVGIEVDVPLQIGRRRAALEQARAEVAQERSEAERMGDEVRAEVRSALEELAAARHQLEIVRDRSLPATRDQLEAARAAYEAGRTELASVIEAERALRDAELAECEALAQTSRRAAALAAALGATPGLAPAAAPDTGEGRHHE